MLSSKLFFTTQTRWEPSVDNKGLLFDNLHCMSNRLSSVPPPANTFRANLQICVVCMLVYLGATFSSASSLPNRSFSFLCGCQISIGAIPWNKKQQISLRQLFNVLRKDTSTCCYQKRRVKPPTSVFFFLWRQSDCNVHILRVRWAGVVDRLFVTCGYKLI